MLWEHCGGYWNNIYCLKFSFSVKDCVLMNLVALTVLPREEKRPKRNPLIQLKVDYPSLEGYEQIPSLEFVLPTLVYQFFPSLILKIFKLHNQISDICLARHSYSVSRFEAPILCTPDTKNQLFRKDPDVGKDWRKEKKGMTDNEMAWWHHWLNRHEFEQTLGDSEGLGSLACCSPWGWEESDTTEQLNNNNENKTRLES